MMDEHENNKPRILELLRNWPAMASYQVADSLGLSPFDARTDLEILVQEGHAEKFRERDGVILYTVPGPDNTAA